MRATLGRIVRAPFGLAKTAKLRLRERFMCLPVELITDQFAFSFADSGWHFFREIVASYQQDPKTRMRDSTFWHFFQHKRVRSVRYLNDLLFLHDTKTHQHNDSYNFYLGTFPWGEWGCDNNQTGGLPWGHHYDRMEGENTRDQDGYRRNPWYRPGDDYPLGIEWRQTLGLYGSLRQGYRPMWYGTYPAVVLLIRNNGEMRAMVFGGQHRMAVLTHLGYKTLSVMVTRDSIGTIHEGEVDDWYYVRNGLCTKELALRIFHAYFRLNGRERIRSLGLPTTYG